jgi:hypothetical protein
VASLTGIRDRPLGGLSSDSGNRRIHSKVSLDLRKKTENVETYDENCMTLRKTLHTLAATRIASRDK